MAVHHEVDSLLIDGWKVKAKYCSKEDGLLYYLTNGRDVLSVSTNAERSCMTIRKNGYVVKCQSFGVLT